MKPLTRFSASDSFAQKMKSLEAVIFKKVFVESERNSFGRNLENIFSSVFCQLLFCESFCFFPPDCREGTKKGGKKMFDRAMEVYF